MVSFSMFINLGVLIGTGATVLNLLSHLFLGETLW